MMRRAAAARREVCVCVLFILWGDGVELIPKDPRRKSSGGPRLRGPGSGACQDQLGDKPLVGYLENPSLHAFRRPCPPERGAAEEDLAQSFGSGNHLILCGAVFRPFTSPLGPLQGWGMLGWVGDPGPAKTGLGTSPWQVT